jgi:hypothetical protein
MISLFGSLIVVCLGKLGARYVEKRNIVGPFLSRRISFNVSTSISAKAAGTELRGSYLLQCKRFLFSIERYICKVEKISSRKKAGS